MTAVLGIVAPVYLAVAIGFIAVRTGLIPAESLTALGGFVVKVALPALLFGALTSRHITEVVQPGYLLAYAAGSLLAMAFGYLAMRSISRRADLPSRAIRLRSAYVAMGAGTSNSGYVGFPVLQGALPSVAAPAFGMNVLVENFLTIPLGMALAERAAGGHASRARLVRDTALRLLTTPMIVAIIAGTVWSLLRIPVPSVLAGTVTLFAQATTALALFVIGGTLVGQSAKGNIAAMTPLVVGKLVVHPLAVAGAVYVVVALAPHLGIPPLDPRLQAAAVISAAGPTITIFPILAARHGEAAIMSAAAFVCTLCSLISLTAVLVLLGPAIG